jgi:hypothetical protein
LASKLVQPGGNVLGDQHSGLVGQEGRKEAGGHSESPEVSSRAGQGCLSVLRAKLPEVELGWCRRLQAVQNQGR